MMEVKLKHAMVNEFSFLLTHMCKLNSIHGQMNDHLVNKTTPAIRTYEQFLFLQYLQVIPFT